MSNSFGFGGTNATLTLRKYRRNAYANAQRPVNPAFVVLSLTDSGCQQPYQLRAGAVNFAGRQRRKAEYPALLWRCAGVKGDSGGSSRPSACACCVSRASSPCNSSTVNCNPPVAGSGRSHGCRCCSICVAADRAGYDRADASAAGGWRNSLAG